MKKALPWIAVLLVLAIVVFWGVGRYNGMVGAEESVETAWSQVENQYQRLAARARATQMTIDPANATPEQLAAYQEAQGQLSQALGRLMAVAEAYPDLKANTNFRDLQAQLEGTENRITVARQNFNETAKQYNTMIRKFPNNIIASMFGFEKKPYFEAEQGAEKAPKVQF